MDQFNPTSSLITRFFLSFKIYFPLQSLTLKRSVFIRSTSSLIQPVIPSWNISTHSFFSYHLGDNVNCSCSFLYLSPVKLASPSLFIPKSIPTFPNPASWLSSTFNTLHFIHFITTNLINIFYVAIPSPLFFQLKFETFVQQ